MKIKRRLTANVVCRLVNYYFVGPDVARRRRKLLAYVQKTSKTSASCASIVAKERRPNKKAKRAPTTYSILPEIETYLHLLVVIYLFQENRLGHVRAIKCCESLMKMLELHNLRLLDLLAAKVYYFYCLMHERIGKLSSCCKYLDKRLLVAKLHHHDDTHATLTNCLLRLYIVEKSFDLASTLIEDDKRCPFPPEADVYQWARFHYYTGLVRATQRRYDEARQALISALKKAPLLVAEGFRYSIVVVLICVELLLGHLPDRLIYREYASSNVVEPYLKLAQAVRDGDVKLFDKTLEKGWKTFDDDQTLNFVVHLKDSVIRAALRQLSAAYSKIYIRQICKKLQFDHQNDAIAILSKFDFENFSQTLS
uniref:PCI domain-containing protein n=1 Tax=Romanomermis culicivorax TaxID=13658 RepID=A0A915HFT9_ROMCU